MEPKKNETFQQYYARWSLARKPCVFRCGRLGEFNRYRKWVCVECAVALTKMVEMQKKTLGEVALNFEKDLGINQEVN